MRKIELFRFFLLSMIICDLNAAIGRNSSAHEILFSEETIVVSLGSQCEVTSMIKEFGYRRAAFMFDWILSIDTQGVINAINNDFIDFFDENYFIAHPYIIDCMMNTKYGLEFRHDWAYGVNFLQRFSDYKLEYQEIRKKYDRRIERFRCLKGFEGNVLFIRAAFDICTSAYISELYDYRLMTITYKDALTLRDSLRRQFPQLNFTLIIICFY